MRTGADGIDELDRLISLLGGRRSVETLYISLGLLGLCILGRENRRCLVRPSDLHRVFV